MRVPPSVLVVFHSLLLLLTVLVLDASRPRGPATPRATVDMPALIDQFVAVDHGDIGYSSIVSGNYFAALEREGQPGVALLSSNERLAPSETLRQIVRQGAAAVPHLLDHLDDRRKTALEIGRGDWRPLGVFFCRTPDYNARTNEPPLAENDRDLMYHLRHDQADGDTPSHTLTVGDLCFVALGQIVNRDYSAVGYRPTGFVLVSSPTHSPALCAAVRREWDGCTTERHRAALVNDFRWPDCDGRFLGACRRLGYYYPQTLEDLVVPLLEASSPLGTPEKAEVIEEALTKDSSAHIDRAVRDLLVGHPDDDRLAVACMKRLIGRGFDDDIERYCRRRIPVAGDYKESLQEMFDKVGWTPLHLAAASGDMDRIRLLPMAPIRIDAKDRQGRTAVQLASRADHEAVVRFLAEGGCAVPDLLVAAAAGSVDQARAILRANPNAVGIVNEHGRTPLYLAARRSDAAMASLLLASGARAGTADEDGGTPLHLAVYHGDLVMVRLLLEHNAPIDAALQDSDYTPVDIAVREKRKEVLRLLLEHHPRLDRGVREEGSTPLHLAAMSGQIEMAEMLLVAGAPINGMDRREATALHRAVEKGDVSTVRLLLEHGADVAAWCIEEDPFLQPRYRAVHLAARQGNTKLMELLLSQGADLSVKSQDSEMTPLHLAAVSGRLEMTRLLLTRGAQVDARDRYGATPLYRAAEKGHVEIACLLLNHRAEVGARRRNGETPFHAAVRGGSVAVARLLLDHKADVNATSEDPPDDTPLRVAVFRKDVDMARLLLSRGAVVNAPDRSFRTALHDAVSLGDASMVRLLLQRGAVVNEDDLAGTLPLHEATRRNDVEVARLLLDRGADVGGWSAATSGNRCTSPPLTSTERRWSRCCSTTRPTSTPSKSTTVGRPFILP